MTRQDFLCARWVILTNFWYDLITPLVNFSYELEYSTGVCSDTSTVVPANKDHPFCLMKVPYEEGILVQQVSYHEKLMFGIFQGSPKLDTHGEIISYKTSFVRQIL